MPRKKYESSDSDSDEEREVVNFKRARKSGSENGNRREISPPKNTRHASSSLSMGAAFNHSNRKYVHNDHPQTDVSVPAGRSLSCYKTLGEIIQERNIVVEKTFFNNNASKGEDVVDNNKKIELSSSQIMDVMGFEKGRGLAKYLEEAKPPPAEPKFDHDAFFDKVKELNIQVKESDALFTIQNVNSKLAEEKVEWISNKENVLMRTQTLLEGREIGSPIMEIVIDPKQCFVNPTLYSELISCKKLYESMNEIRYRRLRSKTNLFEKVCRGPFICRAAMKMANLDTLLNHQLTSPKNKDGSSMIGQSSLLYFADVCAGPGGFTEYILWKKKWEAKGFGFTLKGDLDFDLKNFCAAESESFDAYYGPAGDGNIYNPDNVAGYIYHVMTSTGQRGVHLMMADGGFTVLKREHLQEVLSYQIILSQFYVALQIVTPGGNFVCKLFDTFTPFTVGLIWLMYQCFETIGIHKPLTSRPANSERYLICKRKKGKEFTAPVAQYLGDCHNLLWKFLKQAEEGEEKAVISQIVPCELLTVDPFYDYIKRSNERQAQAQIATMHQMITFLRDETMNNETIQVRAKKKALALWKIPEKVPLPAVARTCDTACKNILGELQITFLRQTENDLSPTNIEQLIKSAYDWRYVVVSGHKATTNRGFYMSLGQSLVYRYEGAQWVIITQNEPLLEIPSQTLVYAEFVHEVYGRAASDQRVIEAFHIIDGIQLGGIDIQNMHYTQRQEMCAKFAKSINRPNKVPVRAKIPIRMENLTAVIDKLEHRVVQGAGTAARLVCPFDFSDPYSPYIIPEGLLFIKITRDPWRMALNRHTNKKYFFNMANAATSDNIPENAISGFYTTMMHRVLWSWDKETNVTLSRVEAKDPRIMSLNPSRMHTCTLLNYINYTITARPTVSPTQTALSLTNSNEKTE